MLSLGVMGLGGWTWPEILPPAPPSGGAAGLAAPLDCFRCTGVILHADRKSNGRDGKSNGRDGKSNGKDM